MRPIIREIYSKVTGTDIFIVGGGHSLAKFDFSRLIGKNVIAVNSAYRYIQDENLILYWGDASFGSNEEANLSQHPSKYKFTSNIFADRAIAKNALGVAGANLLRKTGDYGYDPNVNHVRGNNSGTQALNFAVNLHPSRIILLGYDMRYTGSKSHFHDHHITPTASKVYPELFIPSMESLAKEIKHLKIDVINCSLGSSLECFKKDKWEPYL